jgi:hypothetical protein
MVANQRNRWPKTFASTPQLSDPFWFTNSIHRTKGFASMCLTAILG